MTWFQFTKRAIKILGLALVVLAAVLVFNTLITAPADDPAPAVSETAVDTDAAAKRLAASVRFKTLSKAPGVPVDPRSFVEFHRFLEASYPKAHEALKREVVGGYSLIYRWEGSDPNARPILLLAHQDVVPPNGKWAKPPFAGLIEDGFIWGRGTLDDKVSVLGILEAVEGLIAAGFTPRRTVYLAFGHDEEIDGKNGAQAIAALFKQRGIRFDFALDEGSPLGIGLVPGIEPPVALIGTSEKGYLSIEMIAKTTGGHSSIPSRASAMRVSSEALIKLWRDGDRVQIGRPFSDTLDALTPHLGFTPRLVLANRWLFDRVLINQMKKIPEVRAMITTTGAVTIIKAGDTENVLPSTARTVVNYRLLPGTTAQEMLARVRRVVRDPAITVRQLGEASDPSPIAPPNSETFQMLAKTTRQVFPDALVAPTLVIAATDARHYVGVADHVYRFLPTRLTAKDLPRMHGVDERIAIENYGEIIRFYGQLLRNGAG